MKRESSPPEAILFNGPGSCPGFVEIVKVILSIPLADQAVSSSGSRSMKIFAFSSFNGASSAFTAAANFSAAFWRCLVTTLAASTYSFRVWISCAINLSRCISCCSIASRSARRASSFSGKSSGKQSCLRAWARIACKRSSTSSKLSPSLFKS